MCPHCGSVEFEAAELSGRGTLYSYAVLHHPQHPSFDYPVLAALVDLDEGVRLVSSLVDVDPADIAINLHHAYRRPEFRARHYASFHTGPSATADIEGVLIHGAQGVRSLSVLPLARAR